MIAATLVGKPAADGAERAPETEAAREFGCPRVDSALVPSFLAGHSDVGSLAADDGALMPGRTEEMMAELRRRQPDISDMRLVNALDAALCPAVANMPGLSNATKRRKLLLLSAQLRDRIAAITMPPGSHVVIPVPLTPGLAEKIDLAAAARHETPGDYLADLIADKVTPP
jgi:hypothetical protein